MKGELLRGGRYSCGGISRRTGSGERVNLERKEKVDSRYLGIQANEVKNGSEAWRSREEIRIPVARLEAHPERRVSRWKQKYFHFRGVGLGLSIVQSGYKKMS